MFDDFSFIIKTKNLIYFPIAVRFFFEILFKINCFLDLDQSKNVKFKDNDIVHFFNFSFSKIGTS